MAAVIEVALHLVHPGGRMNRKGFLLAACVAFALQILAVLALWYFGAAISGRAALALNAMFCWLGFAAIAKRLHDLDLSAWWMLAVVVAWAAGGVVLAVGLATLVGPDLLEPGRPVYFCTIAMLLAPLLVAAIRLHTVPGNPGANRYGPVPGPLGLSGGPRLRPMHFFTRTA